MENRRSTAAIILAAGSSSRMGGGRHKLLLPLDERPVLAHVLDAALASQARPIILILGHHAEQVRAAIATYTKHPEIAIVENTDYLQGMSTSMRVGLEVLMGNWHPRAGHPQAWHPRAGHPQAWHPQAWHPQGVPLHFGGGEDEGKQVYWPDSALIMLGDQPLITAQIIDTLIQTWQETGRRIVAPLYEGRRGNPTLFAASLFPELLEVTGDEGGRRVVERHLQELATVELGDAVANYDVDTWEAYQEVVEMWKKKN
jgi:molybdenum cofactor cytidylyltransferase